jgi:hypothetical protein
VQLSNQRLTIRGYGKGIGAYAHPKSASPRSETKIYVAQVQNPIGQVRSPQSPQPHKLRTKPNNPLTSSDTASFSRALNDRTTQCVTYINAPKCRRVRWRIARQTQGILYRRDGRGRRAQRSLLEAVGYQVETVETRLSTQLMKDGGGKSVLVGGSEAVT